MTTKTETSGFTLLRSQDVPLLQAKVYEFEHSTGAKLLHFECADDDLRFAAVIPTVPTDETGAPHILEHCLFSGSKHYPDAASRGNALITGGGAWTGWEYTWYFFSGPRAADFLQRIDIWCDSLFEPLLERETFAYQAHHYEFEDPDDASTPLRVRGVIYNEQKGILGHPIAVGWAAVCRALFPGHPYSLEHGGTPRDVPTIAYEQLKAFHERHYHPANAHFLTWGSVPLEDLLATFDKGLSRVPARPFTATPYPPIPGLAAPVRHHDRIPIGANEDPSGRSMVIMAWVTAAATDPYESLLHDLLVELLMGTPASPLREALASSGLGKAVAETYDKYGIRFIRHTTAAGLQDTDPDKADAIEEVIISTLDRVARDGFDDDEIDAALNKLEFQRRTLAGPQGDEGSPTSFWIKHINTPWVAGGDPFGSLSLEPQLERLATERRNGRPVEERLRAWYIDNPDRALVIVEADPGADVRLEEEETAQLAAVKAAMSDEDKAKVIAETKHLREHLESRSAPPAAPSLEGVTTPDTTPPVRTKAAGVPIEAYPTRTNGITYVDLFFDIGSLPDDLWDYVRLFSLAVVRAGGTDLQRALGIYSGGVSSDVEVPVCGDGSTHRRLLRIGGRALERNIDVFVGFLIRLARDATFEAASVRSVIDAALAHAEQQVFISAPAYLRRLAGSRVRASWGLRDRVDGFAQLALLRRLGRASDAELDDVLAKLNRVRELVVSRDLLDIFVAASGEEAIDAAADALAVNQLAAGGVRTAPVPDRIDGPIEHEARTFGQPTAFNCEVFATPGWAHVDAPAILVAASLAGISVRADVQRAGTAYNASVDAYSDGGSLVCWSIRDPNIARTYEAFERSLENLREGKIDPQMLALAKVEASVGVNLPLPPAERARRSFLDASTGFGPEDAARFLDALASLTVDDVQRAVSEHVSPSGPKASLTSSEMAAASGVFDVVREA